MLFWLLLLFWSLPSVSPSRLPLLYSDEDDDNDDDDSVGTTGGGNSYRNQYESGDNCFLPINLYPVGSSFLLGGLVLDEDVVDVVLKVNRSSPFTFTCNARLPPFQSF